MLKITLTASFIAAFAATANAAVVSSPENSNLNAEYETIFMLADTKGRDNRTDRRDDRSEDRDDRGDDRQDCRQAEGAGNDKRDCKQDERQDRNDDG